MLTVISTFFTVFALCRAAPFETDNSALVGSTS